MCKYDSFSVHRTARTLKAALDLITGRQYIEGILSGDTLMVDSQCNPRQQKPKGWKVVRHVQPGRHDHSHGKSTTLYSIGIIPSCERPTIFN